MDEVHVRGHVTFGGWLPDGARGPMAGAMAKKHACDWREDVQATGWVDPIVPALRTVGDRLIAVVALQDQRVLDLADLAWRSSWHFGRRTGVVSSEPGTA